MKRTNQQLQSKMSAVVIILFAFCSALVLAQAPPKPISKEGLLKAVQIGGLTSVELTTYISSMGVNFLLSDEERAELLKGGLERAVVDAITANYHPPVPPKPSAAEMEAAKVAQLSNGGPLSQQELTDHLKAGISASILEQVVEKRGISFPVTTDSAKSVENAGGNRSLIGILFLKQPVAIAVVGPAPIQPQPIVPPVAVATPASKAVVKNIEQAALLKRDPMNYPPLARKEKISGAVKCEVSIDDNGSVVKVRTVSGHPVLAAAAEESIRRWKYTPARLDGKAVSSTTIVEVNFKPVAN